MRSAAGPIPAFDECVGGISTPVRSAGEEGFGILEVVVVLAILGLMILVTMPGLTGYQTTSAMQTTARQFMSDLRGAQENAISQNVQIDIVFAVSGGTATGYSVKNGSTTLLTVTFPTTVHASTTWPGNDIAITALGAVTGPGASPAFCVDNTKGLTNTVSITLATGRALLASGTGAC
ncbi:MAG TPA: type II secretion system protein [bacterium]|nr:type II secretion system protein [bacterium]